MRKIFLTVILLTIISIGEERTKDARIERNITIMITPINEETNIYEGNCIPCHKYGMPMSLERMFMKYLKAYSGEKVLKASLKEFLKNPKIENSIMSDLFLNEFSVKDKTLLSDEDLTEAIDIYWSIYNVRNRLK